MLKLGNFKYSKSTVIRFNWAMGYIKKELKTDRHIIACLGSAGITFNDDVEAFKNFCYYQNAKSITIKINKAIK